tara:strand:+ start:70003 stop:72738 length:2736 start_codon:yes stop_codon:yes gene_type:complete
MACITEDLNPSVPILGCTDPTATNYNADANTDDGSCIFNEPQISGCTDPTASNYNPEATIQPDNCECTYIIDDCPTELVIINNVIKTPVTIDPDDDSADDESDVEAFSVPNENTFQPLSITTNQPIPEECCTNTNPILNELVNGQEVFYNQETEECELVTPLGCPENITVIDGVLYGGSGDNVNPVNEDCCSNAEGFTYQNNFLNPNGSLGACVEEVNFTEEDCSLTLADVSYVNNTVVFDTSQPSEPLDPNEPAGFNNEPQLLNINQNSSQNCFAIDSWYFRDVTNSDELTNPLNPNENFSGGTKLLTFSISELPNIQIGGQISSFGLTTNPNSCFSNSQNGENISNFLNGTSIIVDINPIVGELGFIITTNVEIGNFLNVTNTSGCEPQTQQSAQACSVVIDVNTLDAESPNQLPEFEIDPEVELPSDPCNVEIQPSTPAPGNPYQNLSEACCSVLGSDLGWEYLDGVCYWNPPTPTPTVQIGLSETDIQVLDPDCTSLTVTASFYLERPDSSDCEANDGQDISASLAIYSGNNVNNASTMVATPQQSYSLSNNGYCQWTTITSNINVNDNTPFKVKVIVEGLKECCNYDIFVDDIAVNCQKQDVIVTEDYTTCPGFNLTKVIDNKKSWVRNTETPINRKFAPSPDAELPWRYTDYFQQSGVYENDSRLVLNSKELFLNFNMKKVQPKCPSGYTLFNNQCIKQTSSCPSGYTVSGSTCVSGTTTVEPIIKNNFKPINLNGCQEELSIYELINYKKNFQNFWVKFIEQFVPATTIFVSGEKWSNREDEICEVLEPCDYINNFSESGLGLNSTSGIPSVQSTNKNINKKANVVSSNDKVTSTKNGDYSDNKTDKPILFDNFKASFLKKDDSILTSRRLTLRSGELELLKKGQKSYQNKFKEKVYILETNES